MGAIVAAMNILITGGTGSIGEGVARLLIGQRWVKRVVILSRDEFKQHQLRIKLASPKVTCMLGDIRDQRSLLRAFRGIDVVFHAAAYKHVDIGEATPEEFVMTNIIGSMNVFEAAEASGVKKVVLLSTDKAAHATSVLGMTKGIAERIMIAHAHGGSKTVFCAVRLGNVLASRGSVLPLFVEAIQQKRPITLTDPNMTRFMLTLPETAQFIEDALQHGEQGDIFIKKCSVMKMGTVALALQRIFKSKVPVQVTGRRPGERIHEILANEVELAGAQDMGDYFRIVSATASRRSRTPATRVRDYSSDTVEPLSLVATERALRSLEFIKNALHKRPTRG